MEKRNVKIVCDSSSDMLELDGVDFASAPLKIITAKREYKDDAGLDVCEMVEELGSYSGKSSTSCPNVGDWLEAFGDAEEIFCITITSKLSGSYNAACIAGKTYEQEHPGRRVLVINSLSTGPEMKLIAEKIRDLATDGLSFEEISEKITAYTKKTGLLFMLESLRNLANNGRVKPIVAKVAGLLGIRVVGRASDDGDLESMSKCRGIKKALEHMVSLLKELGHKCGKISIAHVFNEEGGIMLRELIKKAFPDSTVELHPCRGLCSFYAERGGIMVGFERG